MRTFFLWFFAVLGFVFFWIIIGAIYFVVADPFNLRPIVSMLWSAHSGQTEIDAPKMRPTTDATTSSNPQTATGESPTAGNAGVTSEQRTAMEAVGIDATAVATITPEQETCFVGILGQQRVKEIKTGAVPTASEFFAGRGCI